MSEAHIVKSYDDDLNHLYKSLYTMAERVTAQLALSLQALEKKDKKLAQQVIEGDHEIDHFEHEIDAFAVRMIALRQPMARDLRAIIATIKISLNLERIADYATNIAKRTMSLIETPVTFPLSTVKFMVQTVVKMVMDAVDAFEKSDLEKAMKIWHQDREIDEAYNSFLRETLTYMMEHPKDIGVYTELLFVGKHLERAGDHVSNIAEMVHYLIEGTPFDKGEG